MSDLLGLPKLADLDHHVADAFAALRLSDDEDYQPGRTALSAYVFVPYARTGLSAALDAPAGGAVRSSVRISVPVSDEKGATVVAARDVTMFGPGDVLGLDLAQVVRRYPAPGTTNAEDSFLAHVEFDRPELPWLFTAAPSNKRLVPWIGLVVLEADRAHLEPGVGALPQRVHTQLGQLQDLSKAPWAWAHAQTVPGSETVSSRLSTVHAPANLSRLVCPRTLNNDTDYLACVVPTTNVGVQAGLGRSGGHLGPAWTRSPGDVHTEIVLPVYLHWSFSTAPSGDFVTLARRLVPKPAPWTVGRRMLDTSRPGGGLGDAEETESGRRQVIRCALYSPQPRPKDQPPPEAWPESRTEKLRKVLNGAHGLATQLEAVDDRLLPRVGPRIYARFQRARSRIWASYGDQWFGQLNLSPAHRVVAGLGTRVVAKDQEQLMQAAWLQVGEVDRANRGIAAAQLGRFAADSLHRRLASLSDGPLLQLTATVHKRIKLPGDDLSIAARVATSALPPAALGGAFRRLVRLRGPVARRLDDTARAPLKALVAAGDFRREYAEPDGIGRLSPGALEAMPPAPFADLFGVSEEDALSVLAERVTRHYGKGPLADRLLSTHDWQGAQPDVDAAGLLGERVAATVQALTAAEGGTRPTVATSLARLLAGVLSSGVDVSPGLRETAVRLARAATDGTSAAIRAVAAGQGEGGTPVARSRSRAIAATTTEADIPTPLVDRTGGRGGTDGGGRSGTRSDDAVIRRLARGPGRRLAQQLDATKQLRPDDLSSGLAGMAAGAGIAALGRTPDRAPFTFEPGDLLARLDPKRTVTDQLLGRLRVPPWLPEDWFDDGRIDPVMAAPVFRRPMYQALDAYDRDWLIPGLGLLEGTDLVSALATNDRFTEAFLVGLSDEMGRELLWRGYPTDQRGTYFRRFWNAHDDELNAPIHEWGRTALGTHVGAGAEKDDRVVLLMRGEVFRRYPDAIVLAVRAMGTDDEGRPELPEDDSDGRTVAPILFHAFLPPDVLLIGFELTVEQARQESWWFVVSEHPTAPRFRFDADSAPSGRARSRPAFVPVTAEDKTSATVADRLLHDPVRVAFSVGALVGS